MRNKTSSYWARQLFSLKALGGYGFDGDCKVGDWRWHWTVVWSFMSFFPFGLKDIPRMAIEPTYRIEIFSFAWNKI